jgi:hypothetical protein
MPTNVNVPGAVPAPDRRSLTGDLRHLCKRLLAGNPLYLASAGLFLYGINTVTTDPRLVGAELSLLQFNFSALALYEIILAVTAIALARRRIWYDSILLVALANLFIIVPFSLISRAVYLSSNLALAMCVFAGLFAALKIWAFKQFIPGLNLPRRLLWFGGLLLLLNAAAPARFKAMAEHPKQILQWLDVICLVVLPVLTGLAHFLPNPAASSDLPLGKRWIPLAFYLGWIVVTAFHVLGIAYSSGLDWSFSLLVPSAWALAWVVQLRLGDFITKPSVTWQRTLPFVPLLVPLLASGHPWILCVFGGINFCWFATRLLLRQRSGFELIQFLAAAAIFLGGLPLGWVHHVAPGLARDQWIAVSLFVCFFWLVFLSRDPRMAIFAAVVVAFVWGCSIRSFAPYLSQFLLLFLLAHSFRWKDDLHRGAKILRHMAGQLWLLQSWAWVQGPAPEAGLVVCGGASLLLGAYTAFALCRRSWHPRAVPIYGVAVLMSEPAVHLAGRLKEASPGFIAIAASFILFGLGSLAAFTKTRWNRQQLPAER